MNGDPAPLGHLDATPHGAAVKLKPAVVPPHDFDLGRSNFGRCNLSSINETYVLKKSSRELQGRSLEDLDVGT